MQIKLGYSMGYAGTDSEWTQEIPQDVVDNGKEAIEEYLAETREQLYSEACEQISVWAEIEE